MNGLKMSWKMRWVNHEVSIKRKSPPGGRRWGFAQGKEEREALYTFFESL